LPVSRGREIVIFITVNPLAFPGRAINPETDSEKYWISTTSINLRKTSNQSSSVIGNTKGNNLRKLEKSKEPSKIM
jgi:hypothetical protein